MSAIRLAAATTFTATTNVSKSTLLSQVYQFVNHVSSMVMLSGERTLEMLMAAVMVLGRWRWWCEQHRGAFNSLLGIAEGLVQDLGLNCNPRQMKEEENMVTDIEKRLLLGVWYLRSWYVFLLLLRLPSTLKRVTAGGGGCSSVVYKDAQNS